MTPERDRERKVDVNGYTYGDIGILTLFKNIIRFNLHIIKFTVLNVYFYSFQYTEMQPITTI